MARANDAARPLDNRAILQELVHKPIRSPVMRRIKPLINSDR
jgi:hypothetical protein